MIKISFPIITQNLYYFAALSSIPSREAKAHVADLLELLGLQEAADRRVMYYSTGMRQKLILGRTLLADPDIILLDEPARSIDPLMASSLWQFIKEELVDRQGKTVVMATHNLDEARRVCNQVAVLHQGKVRASGSFDELTAVVSNQHRYTITLDSSSDGIQQLLENTPGVTNVHELPTEFNDPVSYELLVQNPQVQVPMILEQVVAAKGKILACIPQEQSLRDVLVALTVDNPTND